MESSSFTATIVVSLSLLLFFSLPFPSFADKECNPHDKANLLQIKAGLNNPDALSSWNPNTDCCNDFWLGVQCDLGRVITLSVFNRNISGQISPAVGNLRRLQALDISLLTDLTGTIPSSITRLNSLIILTLNNNNLSGPIPSFLSKMKNLRVLELSNNFFSGSIPASLNKLTNLVNLRLDHNNLCGQIPQGGILQNFDSSTYESNKCLCGSPLPACS